MLNADEICIRLEHDPGHVDRLAIVPRPDQAILRARGGTSVDLRLGRWFRSFKPSKSSEAKLWLEPSAAAPPLDADLGDLPAERQWAPPARDAMRTSEHFVRFGANFVLHPGRFVLGVTMEWLSLPRTLSGYVSGKSSLGRHGLVIETAAGLHPGFSGCLTLELANVGEVPVAISPGMEICQIFLHRVEQHECDDPGTFSGQRKPAISLPKRDAIFDRLRGAEPYSAAALR
ncbi:dCTP deaminase [Sphingopyxis sp.]|uniref:dCTP deaminase n=1 Tax=Sphingopyxis sp. TaxID=1908224 RepID=UPI002D78C619|nr:dCTP deaminase [Sphingopyxis sp.]HET6523185.1 dCTP deaminase [Sphingopyxis sp.]